MTAVQALLEKKVTPEKKVTQDLLESVNVDAKTASSNHVTTFSGLRFARTITPKIPATAIK